MLRITHLLPLLALLLLAACGNDTATDEESAAADGTPVATAPAPLTFEGPFADMKTALEGDAADGAAIASSLIQEFPRVSDPETGALNVPVSRQYVALAEELSAKYPDDTLAAPPLYHAAEVALALGEPQRAADIYARIHRQYRHFSKAPESLFMLAFTLDENLQDLEGARTHYQQFIDTYPDHTFADDSEMLIKNLGKSDEEILRELESRQEQ